MITLRNVTKTYGSLAAVNDVSFSVEKGEFFGLLGPNGAGKTTIVRMLLGFCPPTRGEVSINGISTTDTAARQRVGYLAEQHRIPPYMNAREYLQRHGELSGLTTENIKREIDALIEKVGMNGKEKQRAGTYSKGMTQRIGLAAAILGRPDLLILDEPVSGLDPLGIRDVRVILEEMRNHGTTIFLNSHLLSEVEKTCTTAAIMNQGRIIVKDAISAIVHENETLEQVFIRLVEKPHAA
jgi:ABC-2 type transport system ATP-binding protein